MENRHDRQGFSSPSPRPGKRIVEIRRLSGLTPEQHKQLRVIAAEVWCPQHYRQLEACKPLLGQVRVGVEHMGAVRNRLKLAAEASPGTVAGKKLTELAGSAK